MVEISEADLAIKNKAVELLNRMISDPKEGLSVKRKIKALIPEAKFPELDVIDTVTEPLVTRLAESEKTNKSLSDRLDNWEKAQKDSADESALQKQLDNVKKSYGFTDEGLQKVVDRMKTKNNPDAESAAAWVASQERKAKPISDSALLPSSINLYGSNSASDDVDIVALNKDPQGWADKKIVEMLNDFAQQDAA